MRKTNVVILGSTGSIGINTLDVISRHPDRFQVLGLSAYNNLEILEGQIAQFAPLHVAVAKDCVTALRRRIQSRKVKICSVESDLCQLVTSPSVDIVVIGMSGSAALAPFLAALQAGKTVAPANKEALVMAGEILMKACKTHKAKIIPIDSEQSAIFQCLEGQNRRDLQKVHLTASGGALWKVPQAKFDQLSLEQILKHPRWKMGKKITVDSATLMNKGFEVIEAQRLFGLRVDQIEVVIHPEAVIHSMVSFRDGSILAQLGVTDMRLPIQYALTYPQRWDAPLPPIDFFKLKKLTFCRPSLKKFPALALAIKVAGEGGTLPAVLNAADEEVVNAFLQKRIRFSQIYPLVERVVRKHNVQKNPRLEDVFAADAWARTEAGRLI